MNAKSGSLRPILALQPEPIQALRVTLEASDGALYTVLVRRWTAAAAARCTLCRTCTAKLGADRQAVCVVPVDEPPRSRP